MKEQQIKENIEKLQNDISYSFKQTSEVIDIIYRKAIDDNKLDNNSTSINSNITIEKNKEKPKFPDDSDIFKEDNKKSGKNKSALTSTQLIECVDEVLLKERLKTLNEVYDLFVSEKYDYLDIFQLLKEKINKSLEKKHSYEYNKKHS